MGLIDVYRINPADQFSVYSPSLKKAQDITYYTLLAKIRGDLNITSTESNIENWNDAYDQTIVAGAVTGYETKTITLTRRDGSTVSFDFQDLNPQDEDTLDMVTTRGNITVNSIDVGGVTTDYLQFDTAATTTLQPGRMAWNTADGTVDLRLMGNNVTLQVGQEQVVRVVNKTGADLLEANYQAVKITGAQGNRLKVGLARADSDANSTDTIGLVTETIANNQEGFITSSGLVRNINTTGSLQGETWADGDVIYLSPTTFGAVTNVKPLAPQHTVILGFVVRAHVNQGQIYVKVDNGYEIDELHNVRITSVANGQFLVYDSTLSVWKNQTVSIPTGTVTSVTVAGGAGISTSGSPITTSGTITVTNTDKGSDQFIFKNIAVAGESTIVADSNNDTLTVAAGTGVSLTTNASTDTLTITNSAPDQTVVLTAGTGISTSGTYPNFTISNTDTGSAQNIFKNFAVAGQSTIVADSNNDTLTAVAGTGITLTTNATTDTLTITNSAPDQVVSITGAGTSVVTGTYPNFTVTSADQYVGTVTSVAVSAGTGITVSGSPITTSGTITVTNNDRGSSQNIFKNIAVPGQPTIVASTNNDTFTIKPGSGISATTLANDITISNTDPGSAQAIFKNIAVSGQPTVVADSNNDTLTLVAGANITLTTNATTDSITIDASVPTSATPGDAEYGRDYATPFVVPATWAVVNLNATDIRVATNKVFGADNRGYFIVTFELESTDANPQFRMFKYKLYNATGAADIADSEGYWVGYMYGTSEVPYTTFSFHIPSADASVSIGDVIELQVQEISSGTAPNIVYAALSYIDANG